MFNLCKKYKLILTNGKSGLLNIVNKKQNLAVSRSLCCSTAYRNVEHFENLPNGISVTFENKAKHKYHFAWLRDHCRCEKCYNVTTNQREVENVISYDIKPKQIQNIDGYLQVTWLDDHISKFDGSWLQQHRYGQQYSSSIVNGIERYFWDGSLKDKMPPTVDYTKVTNDSEEVLSLLQTIGKYGFGFVSGTPTTKEAMENICRMIGPVRETVYGGVDEFCNIPVDEMEHFDTAYLSIALNGHTDGTYFIDTPGLQLFHCHQHSGGVGGETLLVDGIGAAYKLKEIDPESFEFLCTTSVPAHYHKPGFITQVLNTIIRIDASSKEIYQVRINNYDRDVLTCLSYEDVERFYKALHSYMSILKDPQNELWFKLTPGNVILINNWRVLHGRSSFTGSRTICYGYVGIDDFLGKLRGLKNSQK